MEGSSFRCQAVSWIKMSHLFTKRSAQSVLAKQGGRREGEGQADGGALTPSRPAKSHYSRVWKAISGGKETPVGRVTDWAA